MSVLVCASYGSFVCLCVWERQRMYTPEKEGVCMFMYVCKCARVWVGA